MKIRRLILRIINNFKLQRAKSLKFGVYFIIFVLTAILHSAHSQTNWYKYPGNPVFEAGKPDEWDFAIGDNSIIFKDSLYQSWYIARDWSFEYGEIGYASSTDGINWNKYEKNPLSFKCKDTTRIAFICLEVRVVDSMYYMWYSGKRHGENSMHVGFASSGDGLNWDLYPDPILPAGKKGEFDEDLMGIPAVYYDGKKFHMWYTGGDNAIPSLWRIGYATSDDGIHWKKYAGNPVLDLGESGEWDCMRLESAAVKHDGSKYIMAYSGYNYLKIESGFATSPDGIHWTKFPDNPVLKTGDYGIWDDYTVAIVDFIMFDSIFKVWYGGHRHAEMSQLISIGYATTSQEEVKKWKDANIVSRDKKIEINILNHSETINVDSLQNLIPEISGQLLVDVLNKLALAYSLNDNAKSMYYAGKAAEYSEQYHYPEGKALAAYSLGIGLYVLDDYTGAMAQNLVALHLFDSLGMSAEYAELLNQVAFIHDFNGSYDHAIRYYEMALNEFKEMNDTATLFSVLSYLGYAYLESGDTVSALVSFKEKLKIANIFNSNYRKLLSYQDIGVCFNGSNLDSSIYYHQKARRISDSLHYKYVTRGFSWLKEGEAYFSFGPKYYDNARYCYDSCSFFFRFDGRRQRIRLWFDLAELDFYQGRYTAAKTSLKIAEELCVLFPSNHTHEIYPNLTDKLESEVYLKKYLGKIYWLFYRVDSAIKNDKDAFKYYKLAAQWKDSIYNEQNRRQIAMMQGKYETESAQNHISMLQKENEVKDLRIRQSGILLISMGAFLILFVLMTILFIRQNKMRAEHKAVLLEQKLLRLQMNPHFIFNALSNILNLINRNSNEIASKYLTRFSKLLRNTLEGSRQDLIKLEDEITGLENYLELQKLRFGDKFEYDIHVDDDIDTENTTIPPLLVQPFIENAIEHGIKHKKSKGHVYLRFLSEENQVVCEIEDDGVGREKAWELEYSKHKDHESLATTIIRERIQNLNKNLKDKISFKIIDLKSESDEAIGTKVVIALPA